MVANKRVTIINRRVSKGHSMLTPDDEQFSKWLELRADFVKWQGWFDENHTSEKESDKYDGHAKTQQLVGLMKKEMVCGVRWTALSPDEVNLDSMLTLQMMKSSSLSDDKNVQDLLSGKTDHLERWRSEAAAGRLIDLTRFAVRQVDSDLFSRNKRRRIVRRQKVRYARLIGTLIGLLSKDYNDGCTMVFATSPAFEKFLTSLDVRMKIIAKDDTTVFIETSFIDIRDSFRLRIGQQKLTDTIGILEVIRSYGGFRKMAADKKASRKKSTSY
ncbi:hypothetical protein FWG95_01040 [Candidatus Saccharibacteria bacterium]|nr:hypothetical protein [Candidatus Saccharibacteria bacterium]